MLQLEDGRNADDAMVRGSRAPKNPPEKRPASVTMTSSTLDAEEDDVPEGLGLELTGVIVSDVSDTTGAWLLTHTLVGMTETAIAPLADSSLTPVVSPVVTQTSPLIPPSPSTPSKTNHAKRAATFSPKARQHRKKVASPSSAEALMALAMVSKEKLASKEAERKEAALIRDERQSKLEQMHIDRDIQLEKMRND
ncbi:hypothetical protein DFH28DRAFT_925222 [Melampsora americana]|nr:hypothetical protein DFH28DRAFT_925222 [Melampsora americana]